MGLLDDIFDTKICNSKDTKINYTPMKLPTIKFNTKKEIAKVKNSTERENKLKQCATWVYINSVEWCIAMKGTHIHKKCMEEIFDNLDSRKGIPYSEYVETLVPEWAEYWYDSKNHRHYTRQQLKRIEREFDKGRESEDLVYEMLQYVWFNMIPEQMLHEDIDDVGIYKLRIKWCKQGEF